MKIKIFKELKVDSYWAFEDEKLKIHKILNGPNKGKILFYFLNEETNLFNDKFSMLLGCAMILDTKYERKKEIREITLGPIQFRKVYVNTITAILERFCEYDNKLISIMKERFSEQLKQIPENSNNLGDMIDALKIIKYEFKLITEPKKYNL